MKRFFVDWICSFVREDAGAKAGDNFLNVIVVSGFKDIKVDEEVIFEHINFLVHIFEETTDIGGEVDDDINFVIFEVCV